MNQPSVDLSLFRWIPSQTSEEDRSALLTMREAVCALVGHYRYLEVGSHLGGSLQPHVADQRCLAIYSIDPRPQEQPDERLRGTYKYDGNSTARMFQCLGKVPNASLSKITTFEQCSWEIPDAVFPTEIDFVFVDGEHTHSAVLRDFEALRKSLKPISLIAFHDCFVTPAAITQIEASVASDGQFFHYPNSNIVCFVFGGKSLEQHLLNYGWAKEKPDFETEAQRLKHIARDGERREAIKRKFPRLVSFWRWLKTR